MNRTTRRTRVATTLVAAPLAMSLVACGSDDTDADDRDDAGTTATTVAPASGAATVPSRPTDTTTAPVGDLDAAARTALAALDGSTVFSIDRNSAGEWEVSLVDAQGAESDVDVSLDGTSVTRGPVADNDGDDGDDIGERRRLLDAPIDYVAALEAAGSPAGSTAVTGIDLDEDNGTATWEVQFDEDTATEQTVVVDATTGRVLRTEQDD